MHNQRWERATSEIQIGENVPNINWSCQFTNGEVLKVGSDRQRWYSRLDYFLQLFPPKELEYIVEYTNIILASKGKVATSPGEIIKFLGICILITRFEFGSRRTLWSTTAPSKYKPAAALGQTGMAHDHFDELFSNIRFSFQPLNRPRDFSSEKYSWMLVKDFVDNFNDHRKSNFVPSDRICVDESISRWYGLGGYWINMGLPQYVAIDRKPENGCEIQNAACGRSGVMLRLKLVETAESEDQNLQQGEEGLLHGTVILKYLVAPWFRTNRIVCADSYFASVSCAEELNRLGLKFIGVVKTATRRFPLTHLSAVELNNRGDRYGLLSKDEYGLPKFLSFVWMDRERRYFISTTASLEEGRFYSRTRWRQIDLSPNADPERVELQIPQPKACEIYYDTCQKIDQHNRYRQDFLQLEQKLETNDWSMRVNLSIFGMIVVDTYLVYSQCTMVENEKQADFFEALAEEMIDNEYEAVRTRSRSTPHGCIQKRSPNITSIHYTPTKRRHKSKDGTLTNHAFQGRCVNCTKKSKYICSGCAEENPQKEKFVCPGKCFTDHLKDVHIV